MGNFFLSSFPHPRPGHLVQSASWASLALQGTPREGSGNRRDGDHFQAWFLKVSRACSVLLTRAGAPNVTLRPEITAPQNTSAPFPDLKYYGMLSEWDLNFLFLDSLHIWVDLFPKFSLPWLMQSRIQAQTLLKKCRFLLFPLFQKSSLEVSIKSPLEEYRDNVLSFLLCEA